MLLPRIECVTGKYATTGLWRPYRKLFGSWLWREILVGWRIWKKSVITSSSSCCGGPSGVLLAPVLIAIGTDDVRAPRRPLLWLLLGYLLSISKLTYRLTSLFSPFGPISCLLKGFCAFVCKVPYLFDLVPTVSMFFYVKIQLFVSSKSLTRSGFGSAFFLLAPLSSFRFRFASVSLLFRFRFNI